MFDSLSPSATILASREAEARRAADFRFFSCQVSPLERSSLSVSTKEATRSPKRLFSSSRVTSVSSTVSCRAAAARISWSSVMLAAIVIASREWTIYGSRFPRRAVPRWASTAKRIARSSREVSNVSFPISHCLYSACMKGRSSAWAAYSSPRAWLLSDWPFSRSRKNRMPTAPWPFLRI